jgi:hypothetical protein
MRRLIVVTGLIAAMYFPAAAQAGDGEDPFDTPAIDQYVEAIPTAAGPRPTSRPPDSQSRALAPTVERTIRQDGGDLGDALVQVATSPGYGAPSRGSEAQGPGPYERLPDAEDQTLGGALSDALPASDDPGGRLGVLGGALIAITLATLLVAARRHRNAR